MCCGAILKVLLYVFNAVFFLTGVALIVVGSLIFADLNSYVDLIDHEPLLFAILFISIGCIVVISTFFGCFDMCKKCGFLIFVYTAFLCCVLVLEAGTGISAFMFRDGLNTTVSNSLMSSIANHSLWTNDDTQKKQWDNMQQSLECCGAQGIADWGTTIPPSCCSDDTTTCTSTTAYQENCIYAAYDELDYDAKVFASIGVVFACIQVIGIIITFLKGACCCC